VVVLVACISDTVNNDLSQDSNASWLLALPLSSFADDESWLRCRSRRDDAELLECDAMEQGLIFRKHDVNSPEFGKTRVMDGMATARRDLIDSHLWILSR
jgi:hypothetical protein